MRLSWLPWRLAIRWLSRRHGFIDPAALLSRLESFAQPSDVTIPMELLRAGAVFHARGLINARAIQQNLDWIWPYWVVRQFDPSCDSFLPRAFSITHVNLTHRNWTAVGVPDCSSLPIVDPCGLTTPTFDGWSIEPWVVTGDGERSLFPSHVQNPEQALVLEEDDLLVRTKVYSNRLSVASTAHVIKPDTGGVVCELEFTGQADCDAWLGIAIRPYNPEGISFINKIEMADDGRTLWVDGKPAIYFDEEPERIAISTYREGDVHDGLLDRPHETNGACDVGLATGVALYPIRARDPRTLRVRVPLDEAFEHADTRLSHRPPSSWRDATADACRAQLPDPIMEFLFDSAVRTIVLHAPGEVFPGPYTYKRFWFRDATFILNALLTAGLVDRVEYILNSFPRKQQLSGFFCSQNGEWDSNGQVLWLVNRFAKLANRDPEPLWQNAIVRGAKWILRKRTSAKSTKLHAGLLPAGFSAEHLGNNDFYYWDDYWSVAGLRAASELLERWNDPKAASEFSDSAESLLESIHGSLEKSRRNRDRDAIPASPYRRMDSGAIGSIVASYPLQIYPEEPDALLGTAEFLWDECRVQRAFFQDMIHSGINPYLTLHLAQAFLRAGDDRFFSLVSAVANLATSTGQWPEAIHPKTRGGCMGDGQHAWAAAEWVMMIRNMFVREELDRLVLTAGVPDSWLAQDKPMALGPTLTPWGPVSVAVAKEPDGVHVSWDADWFERPPTIEVVNGNRTVRRELADAQGEVTFTADTPATPTSSRHEHSRSGE